MLGFVGQGVRFLLGRRRSSGQGNQEVAPGKPLQLLELLHGHHGSQRLPLALDHELVTAERHTLHQIPQATARVQCRRFLDHNNLLNYGNYHRQWNYRSRMDAPRLPARHCEIRHPRRQLVLSYVRFRFWVELGAKRLVTRVSRKRPWLRGALGWQGERARHNPERRDELS